MFSIIILTIGIPGAGKSTWVKSYLEKNPYTYVFSTDEVRKEMFTDKGKQLTYSSQETQWIHEEIRKRVKKIIQNPSDFEFAGIGFGPVILVDGTNTNLSEWIEFKKLGSSLLLGKLIECSVDEAMEHQKGRSYIVPEEIVLMKSKELERNKSYLHNFFNLLL